ncbi:Tetratricopeptide repeat protein 28 [Tupaia chinensis]|uniref:Tetratricopeptide repeat protein 28 n=1 Tax=Tupaia chinensis TaxID=246437 RepID=L9KUC7_TUPCH|nr:Tetratricopeptide repeat protein 28 [Tupaia chinensis]
MGCPGVHGPANTWGAWAVSGWRHVHVEPGGDQHEGQSSMPVTRVIAYCGPVAPLPDGLDHRLTAASWRSPQILLHCPPPTPPVTPRFADGGFVQSQKLLYSKDQSQVGAQGRPTSQAARLLWNGAAVAVTARPIREVGPISSAAAARASFQSPERAALSCIATPKATSTCRPARGQGLMHSSGPVGRHRQLILVLEGELYLIPFALLKGSSSNEYLYERFALIAVPSIRSLGPQSKSYMVSELLGCQPLVGSMATKERVMSALTQAECVHFATHISWNTSMAAVIGNPKLPSAVMDRWLWGPMPSAEEEAYMVSELLGCQPLMFIHAFYSSLLNGLKASAALGEAMKVVQSSKAFSHPSNWAGFVLIGSDVKLNSPSSLIGQALTEILQHPERARDALRVLLHLVEKSLQRIQNGQRNAMYTSQQSVENKVGGIPGWQALLTAVGFRLDPPASERLQQCSSTIQSLLGLPNPALQALCKLITASETGEQLISRLHQVLVQLQAGEKEQDSASAPVQVSISVQLWRLPGCHEFLAALGFDLCEVGQEEVILKTGKQASRRTVHFALQSLLSLFGKSPPGAYRHISGKEEVCACPAVDCGGTRVLLWTGVYVSCCGLQGCIKPAVGHGGDMSCCGLQGCTHPAVAMGVTCFAVGQGARVPLWATGVSGACGNSTELPKRLSLDSSSSLESLASAQSISNALPLGYQHPPFSPTGAESIASDAISVYSLSSIASSMSFVSKPEAGSEGGGPRGRQDYERSKNTYPQRSTLPRSQLSPQSRPTGSKEEDEYEGFSIISTEPLAAYQENRKTRFSPDHKQSRVGTAAGVKVSVSSKGSVSTPNSPVKMTLIPSPNSPFQKVGKLASSDTGESDQSSTETDSTVKSQEETNAKLDPQELAQKILEETQSHLIAVERLQRSGSQVSKSNNPEDAISAPASAAVFRASETSAFSKPVLSHQKGQPSPVTVKPKPPARSSSLPKVSSGYSSPTTSEASIKDSLSQHSGRPSPGSDSQTSLTDQPLFKLKYPSSPYSAHISKSPRNMSPSSGHQSPAGSAPSPALSYSSAGSARSSPADAPDIDKLKMAAIDEKVQAVHNLKMFWQSTPQHSTGPMKIFRGTPGTMTSKRDVLSLLNLSPRHNKKEEGVDKLELKELSLQQREEAPQRAPPNGHRRTETTTLGTLPLPAGPPAPAPTRPLRLPSGNGYKFLSPGRFFPSSKC